MKIPLITSAAFAGILLSACSTSAKAPGSADHPSESEAYAWKLLYAVAPELRGEPLERRYSGWSGARRVKHPQDADRFNARWVYRDDGPEVYRFIDLTRDRSKAGTPDEVSLTMGRERATKVLETRTYKPARKR